MSDEHSIVKTFVEYGWTALVAVIAHLYKRLSDVEKDVGTKQLNVAEKYATKEELQKAVLQFNEAQRETNDELRNIRTTLTDFLREIIKK